jgi:F0F1-type ATP synthase membrane subunit b/b'
MLNKMKAMFAAFVIFSFLAGTVPAKAFDRDDDRKCDERIRNAENKLHDAERKHGEHSRQAEKRRHELEEARERCHRGDHDHDHDHDKDHDHR